MDSAGTHGQPTTVGNTLSQPPSVGREQALGILPELTRSRFVGQEERSNDQQIRRKTVRKRKDSFVLLPSSRSLGTARGLARGGCPVSRVLCKKTCPDRSRRVGPAPRGLLQLRRIKTGTADQTSLANCCGRRHGRKCHRRFQPERQLLRQRLQFRHPDKARNKSRRWSVRLD